MAIYKYKRINASVDKDKTTVNNNDTAFYTEDKNTASLQLFITWNDKPFDLNNTSMTPVLDLFHQDQSIWIDEPLDIVDAETGVLQYAIPEKVIKHAGNVSAKLFLKNEKESVHVANFGFVIKDSGIEGAVEKEISVNLVEDSVKKIVKENAMELLDNDFKTEVFNGFQTYVTENAEEFKGPKGDTGEQGLQGKQGLKGDKGDKGDKGESGVGLEEIENIEKDISILSSDAFYNEITYNKYYDENSKSVYYVVDIPHKDSEGNIIKLKSSLAEPPMTAREFSRNNVNSAIINASVFNTTTMEPSGVQIKDGVIKSDKKSGTLRTLGIKDDNTLIDFTSDVRAKEILDMGIKNTVTAFYPILNGDEKPYNSIENASYNVTEKNPRQIIAQKQNKDIMFITVEGRNGESKGMTYDEMYDVCKRLGAVYAYCLDGGGSAQTLVRGNLINRQVDNNGKSERKVVDFIYVEKENTKKDTVKSYNYDVGNITKNITEMSYNLSNISSIPEKLTYTSDINNINKTGFYWTGKDGVGSPGLISYGIIHFQVTANSALQLAIPYHESSSNILFRRTVGTGDTNIWREWRNNDSTIWTGISLLNSWSNYGNGNPSILYSKQGNKVYLKGVIKNSDLSFGKVANLPSDITPKIATIIPTTSMESENYKSSAIKISEDGSLELINPSKDWNVISGSYLI